MLAFILTFAQSLQKRVLDVCFLNPRLFLQSLQLTAFTFVFNPTDQSIKD